MPVRFFVSEIPDKKMEPDSEDPEFGKHWGNTLDARKEPNIKEVCENWIQSRKPEPEGVE